MALPQTATENITIRCTTTDCGDRLRTLEICDVSVGPDGKPTYRTRHYDPRNDERLTCARVIKGQSWNTRRTEWVIIVPPDYPCAIRLVLEPLKIKWLYRPQA